VRKSEVNFSEHGGHKLGVTFDLSYQKQKNFIKCGTVNGKYVKTASGIHRDAVYRFCEGVLFFEDLRFEDTRVNVISYTPVRKA
jgi:hypothetical protein